MKKSIEEIVLLSNALSPLIYVVCQDENNFVIDLYSISEKHNFNIKRWSCYKGLLPLDKFNLMQRADGSAKETWIPQKVLEYIQKDDSEQTQKNIYLLHDFNIFINPQIARQIVDMNVSNNNKIVIITARGLSYGTNDQQGIDPILDKITKVIYYDYPSYEEIANTINASIAKYNDQIKQSKTKTFNTLSFSQEEISKFTRSLQGLTQTEIVDVIIYSLVKTGTLDNNTFIQEKTKTIRKSDILEYITVNSDINQIGGLDKIKEYLISYKNQFSDSAKEYGIEPIKGLLLLGNPGCLCENTTIHFNRGKRLGFDKSLSIKEIYLAFHGKIRKWNLNIPTYLQSFDGKKIIKNKLIDIIDKGYKKTLTILCSEENISLTLTPDHPICDENGKFRQARDYKTGEYILCKDNLSPQKKNGKQIKKHLLIENFNINYTKKCKITSIINDDKLTHVYDIQMELPYDNFVANNVIVHNTGKSAMAKTIANLWSLPLLRLDIGKVMGGVVGKSESNMRKCITMAESVSPCVLWVDELEKALSGTKSSNQSDGGTLSRVFGTLLTAMEEGLKDVVLIATANDISSIPPELIRRFNEIFFVDLPTAEEREEIIKIHFNKRNKKMNNIVLSKIVQKTHMFTGAEIEKAIKESIAKSWLLGDKDIAHSTLEQIINETKPIAILMKEQIETIREWAKDRARKASSYTFQENENIKIDDNFSFINKMKE